MALLSQSDLPIRPFLRAFTKELFSCGSMVNGVHIPKSAPREVYLDVFDHPYHRIYCTTCGRDICRGEIFGNGQSFGRGSYCLDCLEVPANFEAWTITYKLRRKSIKHPSGWKSITLVHALDQIQNYLQAVVDAYPDVHLKKLYPQE
jgi:hypothetical protein